MIGVPFFPTSPFHVRKIDDQTHTQSFLFQCLRQRPVFVSFDRSKCKLKKGLSMFQVAQDPVPSCSICSICSISGWIRLDHRRPKNFASSRSWRPMVRQRRPMPWRWPSGSPRSRRWRCGPWCAPCGGSRKKAQNGQNGMRCSIYVGHHQTSIEYEWYKIV